MLCSVLVVVSLLSAQFVSGQNPECVEDGLSMDADLMECKDAFDNIGTGIDGAAAFCQLPCISSYIQLYDNCSFTDINPIRLSCEVPTGNTMLSMEQQMCITEESSMSDVSLAECTDILEASGDLRPLCDKDCAEGLKVIVTKCGVQDDSNPVIQACDSGAVHTVAMAMMVVFGVIASLFV